MLNTNLIVKIKKEFNISIGESKKNLELNNWNYIETVNYIKKKKNTVKKQYNFYSILNFICLNFLIIIKINFNSIIIKNSLILNDFSKKMSNNLFNKNILEIELSILSISLNEEFFLEKLFIFENNNLFFYNHKNILFSLINFKKRIINISCHVIFKKILFLKKKKCYFSLINQNFIKDNNFKIKELIDINLVNYILIINKKGFFFIYE